MTMFSLSLATLRHQARRYLAPGLAVILGVAFVASTLVLTGTLSSSFRSSIAGQYENYSAVVTTQGDATSVPEDISSLVADVDGVEAIDPIRSGGALVRTVSGERFALVTTEASRAPHPVVAGRGPRAPDEVSISEAAASQSDLEIGDTVPFVPVEAHGATTPRATVVGLVDVTDDPRYAGGIAAVFATPEGVTELTGAQGWSEIGVVATGSPSDVVDRVSSVMPRTSSVVVRTATEHADNQVAALTGGTDILGAVFLSFAIIALFVSAIVIANTFAILLARRSRETAMLRAIGATRGQVIGSALLEALVVGLVFSVLGVVAGIALARALIGAANALGSDALPTMTIAVSVTSVVVPVIVGVLVVLVAAVRPVLRSSRIAPLEALRPEASVTARSRRGMLRIGAGLALLLAGVIALVVGATAHTVAIGIVGGLVSFTGVMLAGSIIVPLLARAVGLVASRPFGAAGRLAVENAVRNPARAAATASALIVGVTLVTMTAVGAATTKSAITALIDSQYPVDLVVQAERLPQSSVRALADVEGVSASAVVPSSAVTVSGASVDSTEVVALPREASQVVRDASSVPSVEDGSVVLTQDSAGEAGLSSGDEVTLTGPQGSQQLTVAIADGFEEGWLITETALHQINASAAPGAVYLRLAEGADVDATLNAVRDVSSGIDGSEVGGGAAIRDANMQALDMALAVVLALLAISVIIALVGIANTLSLSVIERTRESALMRALGLTRGQLRGMLAIEAVLLATVGVLLGVALGTGYALAGVTALFGEFATVTPVLPWTQLVGVVGVAVVAGLLASVLPARRAARVAPAAALAVE